MTMTSMQMRWISEIIGRWDETNARGVEKVETPHANYFLLLGQLASPGLPSYIIVSYDRARYDTYAMIVYEYFSYRLTASRLSYLHDAGISTLHKSRSST